MTAQTPDTAGADQDGAWPHEIDAAERWLLGCMMRTPAAVETVVEGTSWHPQDMYRPAHEEIATAIFSMWAAGQDTDPSTLRDWMGAAAFRGAFTPAYLIDLWELGGGVPGAVAAAEKIHEAAVRRRAIEAAIRLRQGAANPAVPIAEVLSRHDADMAAVTGLADTAAQAVDPRVLAGNQAALARRWVIPGMLDAADRVIIVGVEGSGKSLIGAQLAMAVSAGVHPFLPSVPVMPQRTLIVDLEISSGILARRFRWLLATADRYGLDSSLVRVWSRPAGVDLRTADGQMALSREVRRHAPALLVAGPMYKMGLTEADGPSDYKLVADYLDRLRETYGCALWLEQHAPMRQGARPRELRPIGSVLWTQWPEFGFALKPSKAEGEYDWARFRKDRETGRAWPERVYWRSGAGWPWGAEFPPGAFDEPLPDVADAITQAEEERQSRLDELAAARARHQNKSIE